MHAKSTYAGRADLCQAIKVEAILNGLLDELPRVIGSQSEMLSGTSLKCEISCLWRSLRDKERSLERGAWPLRDGARWMSVQYLGAAASPIPMN